jgi:hypothetical protein
MDCTHVYFVDPLVLNIEKLEVNREKNQQGFGGRGS